MKKNPRRRRRRARRNPSVPVLLMNPRKRRSTRVRRRATTAARPYSYGGRKRRAGGYAQGKRRIRRRKLNPSFNIVGMAAAALAGAGLGAIAYGLQGQDLAPNVQTAILGVGGVAAGAVISGWSPGIGAGIAGGAGAIAAKRLLDQHMTSSESTTSAVMGRLYGGRYPRQLRGARSPLNVDMRAVQAQLNAIQARLP